MASDSKKFWKIVGYDGTDKLFERTLPLGSLSEAEMTTLLQRLTASHLTPDEIVNASLRPSAKSYTAFLEPRQESKPRAKRFAISVGDSPNYIASVWDADELEASDA